MQLPSYSQYLTELFDRPVAYRWLPNQDVALFYIQNGDRGKDSYRVTFNAIPTPGNHTNVTQHLLKWEDLEHEGVLFGLWKSIEIWTMNREHRPYHSLVGVSPAMRSATQDLLKILQNLVRDSTPEQRRVIVSVQSDGIGLQFEDSRFMRELANNTKFRQGVYEFYRKGGLLYDLYHTCKYGVGDFLKHTPKGGAFHSFAQAYFKEAMLVRWRDEPVFQDDQLIKEFFKSGQPDLIADAVRDHLRSTYPEWVDARPEMLDAILGLTNNNDSWVRAYGLFDVMDKLLKGPFKSKIPAILDEMFRAYKNNGFEGLGDNFELLPETEYDFTLILKEITKRVPTEKIGVGAKEDAIPLLIYSVVMSRNNSISKSNMPDLTKEASQELSSTIVQVLLEFCQKKKPSHLTFFGNETKKHHLYAKVLKNKEKAFNRIGYKIKLSSNHHIIHHESREANYGA